MFEEVDYAIGCQNGAPGGHAVEARVSVAGDLGCPYLSINGQLSLKRFRRGVDTFRT